jgi:hypothetical protein
MYQTKHDLPARTRADVISILNARLADRIALRHQAKQAQGNVKGPSFIALHTLGDEVVEAAAASRALLTAWIVHLRGTAEGRSRSRHRTRAWQPTRGLGGRSGPWRHARARASPIRPKACRSQARGRRREAWEKAHSGAGRHGVKTSGSGGRGSCWEGCASRSRQKSGPHTLGDVAVPRTSAVYRYGFCCRERSLTVERSESWSERHRRKGRDYE